MVLGNMDLSLGCEAADIDADGLLDLLVTSYTDITLVWYKNLTITANGFSTANSITENADGAYLAKPADIDGDGFIDVVLSSDINDRLVWFKNQDGVGTFSAPILINNFQSSGRNFDIGDLDGDGDLHIVATAAGSVILGWYENIDGLGTFSERVVVDTNSHLLQLKL